MIKRSTSLYELSMVSLPDSNVGGGYGKTNPADGPRTAGKIWPYLEIPPEGPEDEDLDDDSEELSKKTDDWTQTDHLWYKNQKSHAFVKGNTRGLTGIMAGVSPKSLVEVLAGAIGQASPSYNVSGADGTTRTRPGRRTGSKRGWFQPHPPKVSDPDIHRYSLEDISKADEENILMHPAMVKKKVQKKSNHVESRNAVLRAYIRNVTIDKNHVCKQR